MFTSAFVMFSFNFGGMKRKIRVLKPGDRCLMCSKPLDGRLDKVFCTDLCRAKYHNRKKSLDERLVRTINKILLSNREALKEVGNIEKSKLHKEMLVQRGFNFDFFTQTQEHKGKTFKFCYEWGYYMDYFGEVIISQLDSSSFDSLK